MVKITSTINCGNSPKMEFLQTFNTAFAEGNVDHLMTCVANELTWNITGYKKIEGKEQFREALHLMCKEKKAEFRIEQILTHGKHGAAHGTMHMENGKKYAFADFYTFTGASGLKIKSMTSYVTSI